MTGWLALVGCVVAALVENDILGWIGSLLIGAPLNFAGAVGCFAVRRSAKPRARPSRPAARRNT